MSKASDYVSSVAALRQPKFRNGQGDVCAEVTSDGDLQLFAKVIGWDDADDFAAWTLDTFGLSVSSGVVSSTSALVRP